MKSFHISRKNLKTHGENLLFVLPALLIFGFVVVVPFIQGIPYSFASLGSGGEAVWRPAAC